MCNMQHHQTSSQKRYAMLDNRKASSSRSMPTASDHGQTSNGILAQEPAVALKDARKESETQNNVHAQYVLQLLQLQRQAGFLCDITIHVKDRSFKAHKPLLAACSLYFRALFADVTTKESTALSLTSLTATGFEVLLDYIYSGSLAITAENSSEVLSAATCLQMTNVVETCLSFMRSSFRMSKHKMSLTKRDQDDVRSQRSLKTHSIDYSSEKNNMQRNSSMSNNVVSSVLMQSPSKTSPQKQGNLQILSTRTIDESEYKNIINEASEHCGVPHASASLTIPLRHSIPPRAFAETKSTSSPFTSSLNQGPHRQHLSTGFDIGSRPRLSNTATSSIFRRTSDNTIVESQLGNRSTSPELVVSVKTSNAILPDQARLNLPLSSFNSSVSSAKDFSSTSSAAVSTNPPELYSGNVQTAQIPGRQGLTKDALFSKSVDLTMQYSSDEQANSVEISSDDDEGGCNAWGVDRSVSPKSRDLSGTPYSASTTDREPAAKDELGTSPIVKAQSLPSLFDPPDRPTLERASSLNDTAPAEHVITYEKAAQAISALVKSELTTSPSQQIELNPEYNDQTTTDSALETSESAKEDTTEQVIPSLVLRKTLLPKKHERSSSTPRSTLTISDKVPSIANNENSDEDIKIEPAEDVEAFPLAQSSPEKTFDLALMPELLKTASDDSSILDLSMPKRQLSRPNSAQPDELPSPLVDSIKSSSRHSSEISTVSDPGMALAADALSLLKQGKGTEGNWSFVPELQNLAMSNAGPAYETSDNFLEEANQWNQQIVGASNTGSGDSSPKQSVYSRKPRRTTGGQTCTWPGCGRLFRHRNIYEEHQRLHELGIPVSQLRKCYMGARVKKTVREQLEEMRTSDNVFEPGSDGDLLGQARARKRKSISESQEPIRKRVHAKERAPPFQLINQSSTSGVPASKSIVLSAPPRVRHSLSHPLPGSHPNTFLRAPLPPPILPSTNLVKVVGPDGVVRWAQRADASAEVNQRVSVATTGESLAHSVIQSPMQQQAIIRLAASSSHSNATNAVQQAGINPVQQTLALLGIRTPMRRTETGAYALPVQNVASDQMRRRLAIRETTATNLRVEPRPANPNILNVPAPAAPSFDPEAVRARLILPRDGYQLASHDATLPHQGAAIQLLYTKPHSGQPTNPG